MHHIYFQFPFRAYGQRFVSRSVTAEETQLALSLSMLSLLVLLLLIFADTGSVLSAPTSLSSNSKDSTLQAVKPTTVSSESVDPPLAAIWDRQRLMTMVFDQLNSSAFALWNANFSSESEAMEICKQYVANLEAQSPYARGDCRVKYHCSFDPNRFPAVMISTTCTNAYCYTDRMVDGKKVVGDCVSVEKRVLILKYYDQDELASQQNAIARPREYDPKTLMTHRLPVVEESSGQGLPRGEWFCQPTVVTEGCKCIGPAPGGK